MSEAKYRRIAADLRADIRAGRIRPGERIPSEAELEARYGVSRLTVRNAVDLLRQDGIVKTEHGVGSIVLPATEAVLAYRPTLISSPNRRRGEAGFVTQVTDLGLQGEDRIVSVSTVPAPEYVADRLGLDVGDPVVVRERILWLGDRPMAIARNWFPVELVEGTPIANPESVERGTDTLMAEMGYETVRRRDEVFARLPTADEADRLRIPPGVAVVIVVASQWSAEEIPVQIHERIMPADRHVLVYELDKTT